MKPRFFKYRLHCGQLILRKISKTDATRCQILRQKCTKFDCLRGPALDPAAGTYLQRLPRLLAVFKGPTCKGGRGGDGNGRERKRKGKGRGRGKKGGREKGREGPVNIVN